MKKPTPRKKLTFTAESIAHLGEAHLQYVVGGATTLSQPGNPCNTSHSESPPGS